MESPLINLPGRDLTVFWMLHIFEEPGKGFRNEKVCCELNELPHEDF